MQIFAIFALINTSLSKKSHTSLSKKNSKSHHNNPKPFSILAGNGKPPQISHVYSGVFGFVAAIFIWVIYLQRFHDKAVRFVNHCGIKRGQIDTCGTFRIMSHRLADSGNRNILALGDAGPCVAGDICG